MEAVWLTYAKRLFAIASAGATYTRDGYDRERYDEIAGIAAEMLARLADEPVARIEALIGPYAKGYPTPRVDVRGAVFEGDRILLVRERTDGLWALPGGFADVGLSPAANIVKEIREEAGIEVQVRALIGVRHKASAAYAPDVRDFYKLFFACDAVAVGVAGGDTAIAEHRFFALDALPDLSEGRTIRADIEAAFAFRSGAALPFFH